MLRRVQELLARKSPRWEVEDANEPVNWPNLPVEMKREIVKYTDFLTKNRLRVCSTHDQKIVDSLPQKIPFLRVTSDKNHASLTVVESKSQVLRVDVTRKRVRLRVKNVISISDNIQGANGKEIHSVYEMDDIIRGFIRAISHKHIKIETLNLSLIIPNQAIWDYLSQNYREQNEANRTKILVTTSFMKGIESDLKLFAGKKFEDLDPHTYRDLPTEFIKKTAMRCQLGALLAGILWNRESQMDYYWIPHMEEQNPEQLAHRFSGRIDYYPGVHVIRIPAPNLQKVLTVNISECGVSIRKRAANESDDKTCGLGWTCSNCDQRIESWWYRHHLGIEKSP
ncbi:unnamed protein product [Caenorhabditis sp. 36 PRJEB53466]|nr:unnamed protein product [Caenorhabditis sp. 36 PRJEB53466]